MRITSIRKRRSDVEIVFEDQSKIIVGYKVVVDNGLRRNDDLTEEQINELLTQTEKLKIRDSAFRLLGRRAHSVFEISQKLARKGFRKELIEIVISDLKGNNYLNDDNFSQAFVNERLAKRKSGINKIRAELIRKGVNKKSIEFALEGDHLRNPQHLLSLTKNLNR